MSTDLSGGDSTPKLVKASIKDLTLAVNLIAYTFKTPDSMVAPDALQLDSSGNLALGNVPLAVATVGRSFRISNTSAAGGTISNTSFNVESNSGVAFINMITGSVANGIRMWDGTSSTQARLQQTWYPAENLFRVEIGNGTTLKTVFKADPTGKVGIGENPLQSLLNVGVVGQAGNEIYVASNTTAFEGAYLGAYSATSGAKLELNTQASATTVASWQVGHDSVVGGLGRLSFRYATAQTSRNALTYTERVAITPTNVLIGGGQARNVGGQIRTVQLEGVGLTNLSITNNSNDVNGTNISLAKSRGTTLGGSTIVNDGDTIGGIQWVGANGTDLSKTAALITGIVSGAPTATSIPGAIVMSTTKVGDSSVSEALRITNQQNIAIGGASDVARVVLKGGVGYASGEAMLYMQSSSPSTIPSLICGASGGVLKFQGGAPLTTGGAPGGGIDLNAGGASTNPGFVFIRAGTNADGLSSPVIVTVASTGMVGFNQTTPAYRNHVTGNTGERVRWMGDTFSEYAGVTFRRANGTAAVPTKILSGDQVGFINTHVYTGTQYLATGSLYMVATGDHSDTSTPSDFIIAPGADSYPGQRAVLWTKAAGTVGINTPTPFGVFSVCSPASVGGNGIEIDPNTTNSTFRSYNRSTSTYTDIGYAASTHQWGIGTTSPAVVHMTLTTAGNLSLGANLPISGSGVSAVEGKLIVATPATTTTPYTALTIQNGENYAGLKIKAGPTTQANGSCDYFDITTRPGNIGVGSNADKPMIRMEHALSTTTPTLYLQPTGDGGKVVIGASALPGLASGILNVVVPAGGIHGIVITGGDDVNARSDILIGRTATTPSILPGLGPCINLANATANSHILIQESGNGLQLFNYTTGAWGERMFMADTGRFTFGAHSSAAGKTAETIQAIGGATGGTEYCYFAQANTTAQAFAMRMYSTTAAQLVGSITFSNSATAYNTSSDKRLKENIVDAPSAKNVVRSLPVRSFNFIKGGDYYKYSWVAQELYNVAPWAVSVGSAEFDPNFDGMTGIWGVDNSKLVPVLAKAQQETIDDVEALKTDLAQTKSKVTALQSALADVLERLVKLEGVKPT